MSLFLILILWTWGLTPVWVNVVGTVLLGIRALCNFFVWCYEISQTSTTDNSWKYYSKKK